MWPFSSILTNSSSVPCTFYLNYRLLHLVDRLLRPRHDAENLTTAGRTAGTRHRLDLLGRVIPPYTSSVLAPIAFAMDRGKVDRHWRHQAWLAGRFYFTRVADYDRRFSFLPRCYYCVALHFQHHS